MAPTSLKKEYLFGVACVLAGGLCLSLAGVLVRHIDQADGWQILFYRSITFFVMLSTILAIRYRSRTLAAFKAVGWRGLVVSISLGLGSVCYIFALLNTTVANAMFIIGASPLVAAAAGWILLGERVSLVSIVAMLVALGGIGLMFVDGFLAGRLLGNVIAIGVVIGFVVMLVTLRGAKDIDMLPATCMAGLVTASISVFMAADLDISRHDLTVALLLGSVQYGIGFIFYTIATRHIQAAEVALFALSESILAPIWAWVGVGEEPSRLTLVGSAVVVVAVVAHCVIVIRNSKKGTSTKPATVTSRSTRA
jgi:drug/metabolite transporter (DMT)-like permease